MFFLEYALNEKAYKVNHACGHYPKASADAGPCDRTELPELSEGDLRSVQRYIGLLRELNISVQAWPILE